MKMSEFNHDDDLGLGFLFGEEEKSLTCQTVSDNNAVLNFMSFVLDSKLTKTN